MVRGGNGFGAGIAIMDALLEVVREAVVWFFLGSEASATFFFLVCFYVGRGGLVFVTPAAGESVCRWLSS